MKDHSSQTQALCFFELVRKKDSQIVAISLKVVLRALKAISMP